LFVAQLFDPRFRADVSHLQELRRRRPADAVDVCQRYHDALVARDVNARQARHASALPLLVLGIRAENANDALTPDHLALRAHPFDRWTNLHLYLVLTFRILPRDRSLSESSIPTWSPATSRTKWVLRRSATSARTLTPFSSSTLYMPFGRGSPTPPSPSAVGPGLVGAYTRQTA